MSDNKEYISQIQENGAVHISEEVIATIAAAAALETDGVSSITVSKGTEFAEILGVKNPGKGVRITIAEDNAVTVDCAIIVRLGFSVLDVAKSVQQAVTAAIESVTGLKLQEVNITVAGVHLPKEQKK